MDWNDVLYMSNHLLFHSSYNFGLLSKALFKGLLFIVVVAPLINILTFALFNSLQLTGHVPWARSNVMVTTSASTQKTFVMVSTTVETTVTRTLSSVVS